MSTPSCRTQDGVLDLSGNVWEWENSCGESNFDYVCRVRGGAFDTVSMTGPGSAIACDADSAPGDFLPQSATPDLGFRCCASE
jgi:formylglycine-generating enzyme required for sulfatase activity